MFFEDPTEAFANVGRALRGDGRVSFAVWRDLTLNDWMMVPAQAALAHVPMPDLGAPGAPGPYALADPDRVRTILADAGFGDVALEPYETKMLVGGRGTLDDAVALMRHTGVGHGLLRGTPHHVQARVLRAVRAPPQAPPTAARARL